MNKKFLGLFFIVGLCIFGSAQTANPEIFNNQLRAALARRNAMIQPAAVNEEQNQQAVAPRRNQPPVPAPRRNRPVVVERQNLVEPIIDVEPVNPEIIDIDPAEPVDQEINNEEIQNVIQENNAELQQTGFVQRFFGRWFNNNTQAIANPTQTETVNHQANVENQHIFECEICLENISATADVNSDQRLEQTPCKHNFHLNCLNEWKERQNTCPKCRVTLNATENTANNDDDDDEERIHIDQVYKCPICLDPCLETDEGAHRVFATPCQHFFHRDCLEQACQAAEENWGRQACPICRQPLNTVANPIVRAIPTWQRGDELERMQQAHNAELQRIEQAHIREITAIRQQNIGLKTKATLGLASAGTIAISYIPGAAQIIKKTITDAATKVCQFVGEHPRETAGIAAGGTALYALKRGGVTPRNAHQFVQNQALNIALIGTAAYTAKMALQSNAH